MPHYRARHGLELFKNLASFSPIVGIFGHRQVGKTTLAERLAQSYCTFDSKATREAASTDPAGFLKSLGAKPAVIDECQLVPELFSELKEYVRKQKQPGQIILTGSVRFSSRRAIRESLTGRIATLELLPFCLTEILGFPRSRIALQILGASKFSMALEQEMGRRELRNRSSTIDDYLSSGGLPGLFAIRNPRLRAEKLRDQLELILGRDLQLVHSTSLPLMQVMEWVRVLSRGEAAPYHPTSIRKETRVTEITQRKLLQALEAVFMIRQIPIEGQRRGISIFFEDQLEHLYLHQEPVNSAHAFEMAVWRNLRATFNYETGLDWSCFQFLEKSGRRRVPFAFRSSKGTLGILPITDQIPSRQTLESAREFLKRYNQSLALIVTRGQPVTEVIEPRILKIPAERLLFD
ncbi:MAG: hypothetical protein RJB38_2088 [Pseudomonadota bacterium]|jgi:predicted AAA+ superfamily ATPase